MLGLVGIFYTSINHELTNHQLRRVWACLSGLFRSLL